jgi:lipopolysaccharide transport system permease protein
MGGLYMVIFNFLIRLFLVAGVMVFWKVVPTTSLFFFPIAMGAIVIAGFAIGLALTPIAGFYGDIARLIPIVSGFWMLLTPVVYPARTEGLTGILATWNPISPLIVTARETLTGQDLSLLLPFVIILASSLLATFIGLVSFRIAMPHLIARMGG